MTIERAIERVKDKAIVRNRMDAAYDWAEVLLPRLRTNSCGDGQVRPYVEALQTRWSDSGVDWIKREGWRLAKNVAHLQDRMRANASISQRTEGL